MASIGSMEECAMEFLRRSATFMKKTSTTAFGTMLKYPKMSGLLIATPLAHFSLRVRADRRMRAPILARLEEGSRPLPLTHIFMSVKRPELEEIITSFIHPPEDSVDDESSRSFGIILGPSGTGKTALLRQVYRCNPKAFSTTRFMSHWQ